MPRELQTRSGTSDHLHTAFSPTLTATRPGWSPKLPTPTPAILDFRQSASVLSSELACHPHPTPLSLGLRFPYSSHLAAHAPIPPFFKSVASIIFFPRTPLPGATDRCPLSVSIFLDPGLDRSYESSCALPCILVLGARVLSLSPWQQGQHPSFISRTGALCSVGTSYLCLNKCSP